MGSKGRNEGKDGKERRNREKERKIGRKKKKKQPTRGSSSIETSRKKVLE